MVNIVAGHCGLSKEPCGTPVFTVQTLNSMAPFQGVSAILYTYNLYTYYIVQVELIYMAIPTGKPAYNRVIFCPKYSQKTLT